MIAVILTVLPWLAPAPAPAISTACLPVVQDGQQEVQVARVKKGVTAELRPFFDRKTPLLLELPEGSAVEVVRQAVPWSEVRVPGGLTVWVHGDYVNWKDGMVYPKNSRLRARPKPSTAADSHPVGKLKAEWGLTVLAQDGDWLQVIAPEELAAWVLTEQIDILAKKPASWSLSWKAAANKRRKVLLASAEEVVAPVVVEEKVAQAEAVKPADTNKPAEQPKVDVGAGTAPPTSDVVQEEQPARPAVPIVELPEATRASAANEAATEAVPSDAVLNEGVRSARLDYLVTAQALKNQPRQAFELALENLNAHRSEVTANPDMFSAKLLDNVDEVMTAVLMTNKDTKVVEQARTALIRADALRKFHRSTMDARARKADVEQGAAPRPAQDKTMRLGGQGEGTWVGYIKYKPHQYPSTPFVAMRGDREVVVHSYDGRFYLKDYVGRQVVLRGKWRATGEGGEMHVLAVEKLRVLPTKSSY